MPKIPAIRLALPPPWYFRALGGGGPALKGVLAFSARYLPGLTALSKQLNPKRTDGRIKGRSNSPIAPNNQTGASVLRTNSFPGSGASGHSGIALRHLCRSPPGSWFAKKERSSVRTLGPSFRFRDPIGDSSRAQREMGTDCSPPPDLRPIAGVCDVFVLDGIFPKKVTGLAKQK